MTKINKIVECIKEDRDLVLNKKYLAIWEDKEAYRIDSDRWTVIYPKSCFKVIEEL